VERRNDRGRLEVFLGLDKGAANDMEMRPVLGLVAEATVEAIAGVGGPPKQPLEFPRLVPGELEHPATS
jgi:hypothetical protein